MRVCELVGAEQPTVSKHLAPLKNAGLVENGREGPMIYYRVRPACLQGFFACLEAVAAENNRAQGKLISAGG